MESKKENFIRAQATLVRLLALRDHSPVELRKKMKRTHEPEAVEQVLEWATDKGWLPNDEDSFKLLAEKMSQGLHRRGKGLAYINKKLRSIGLPTLKGDPLLELEKAQALVETRFSDKDLKDPIVKSKVFRFLMSRGFNSETINQALKRK